MSLSNPRLHREYRTLQAMMDLFCRRHHETKQALCPACAALLQYARSRLEKCPFAREKPTCSRCPIHCYQPARREQIRKVMRYAGPRMLWRHPLLAVRHLLDGRKTTSKERNVCG